MLWASAANGQFPTPQCFDADAQFCRHFRSITQEAMSRLERTFQIDAALTATRDQKWVDEAITSGPEAPLTKKEMDTIRDRVLRGKR